MTRISSDNYIKQTTEAAGQLAAFLRYGGLMKTLSIDIETYSNYDLSKCGVYKYTESTDFEILLFGYSVNGSEVQVVDLAAGEKLPPEILDALTDDKVQKWAFNANFERVCLSRHLADIGISLDPFADNHHSAALGKAKYLNPASWRCAMVWSAYMGLPLSLRVRAWCWAWKNRS
jgi:DNA polymerase